MKTHLRGASNTILTNEKIDTFVTASTGNHALAVCHILSQVGKKGIIFVTSTIPESKLQKLKKFPFIELKVIEGDPQARFSNRHGHRLVRKPRTPTLGQTETAEKLKQLGELAARKYAEDNGLKFVSPYNDYEVIAGQVRSPNDREL